MTHNNEKETVLTQNCHKCDKFREKLLSVEKDLNEKQRYFY